MFICFPLWSTSGPKQHNWGHYVSHVSAKYRMTSFLSLFHPPFSPFVINDLSVGFIQHRSLLFTSIFSISRCISSHTLFIQKVGVKSTSSKALCECIALTTPSFKPKGTRVWYCFMAVSFCFVAVYFFVLGLF